MTSRRVPARLGALLVGATALAACTMGHDATQASNAPAAPSSVVTTPAAPASSATSSASSTQPSAESIWAATQARVKGATSLSMTATDSVDGSGPKGTFKGERDGEPTETSYEGATDGHATVRHIGHDVYLKGDRTYWAAVEKHDSSSKGVSAAANRWIKVPDSALDAKDLSDISAKSYVDKLGETSDPKWGRIGDGTLTEETLDGTPAYKIVSADGDTSVWVTRDGHHDLVQVVDEAAGTDEFGMAQFSRWNEKIPVPRPAGAIEGGGAASSRPTSSARATT